MQNDAELILYSYTIKTHIPQSTLTAVLYQRRLQNSELDPRSFHVRSLSRVNDTLTSSLNSATKCKQNSLLLGEIWGSRGCNFEVGHILGCCAVRSCRNTPSFRKCLLPPSSRQRWRQQATVKRLWAATSIHGATILKAAVFILADVRTSNSIFLS
jgi:hypothetical protein